MKVEVHWKRVGPSSPRWQWSRCLYLYFNSSLSWPLYIGKADGSTVSARYRAKDKDAFFNALEKDLDIPEPRLKVAVGQIGLELGARLTRELLADVESLLIKRTQPWWNVSATRSRIKRPGMKVACLGDWPYAKSTFLDTR